MPKQAQHGSDLATGFAPTGRAADLEAVDRPRLGPRVGAGSRLVQTDPAAEAIVDRASTGRTGALLKPTPFASNCLCRGRRVLRGDLGGDDVAIGFADPRAGPGVTSSSGSSRRSPCSSRTPTRAVTRRALDRRSPPGASALEVARAIDVGTRWRPRTCARYAPLYAAVGFTGVPLVNYYLADGPCHAGARCAVVVREARRRVPTRAARRFASPEGGRQRVSRHSSSASRRSRGVTIEHRFGP